MRLYLSHQRGRRSLQGKGCSRYRSHTLVVGNHESLAGNRRNFKKILKDRRKGKGKQKVSLKAKRSEKIFTSKKDFLPKTGGTPKRNENVFTAPTGEEITTKKGLQQYLEVTPGGPAITEFDWETGETSRRSSRISGKAKAAESSLQQNEAENLQLLRRM
ncbi:hypothetical protein RND71_009444 [Anisodus tanguticus]|uniref:MBD domain-containing protein n=1 Tax=Anisodus tanguticus TaxID=243964 RepID=A0AAE1VR53_9SOLA|nr:hypothetical protein RND71_009444 [Anisodus tanguticus]